LRVPPSRAPRRRTPSGSGGRADNDCGTDAATESQDHTIRIEVWDGVLQFVSNLPHRCDYEVVDYDDL
jgi:hypothetical protein